MLSCNRATATEHERNDKYRVIDGVAMRRLVFSCLVNRNSEVVEILPARDKRYADGPKNFGYSWDTPAHVRHHIGLRAVSCVAFDVCDTRCMYRGLWSF